MPDENKAEKTHDEKADADGGQTLDKILKGVDSVAAAMDSLSKRMDGFEGRMDSFEKKEEEDKKDDDEDKKDDDDEEEESKEKEEPKRVAADKKKKADAEDKEEKEEKKDDDESKKDSVSRSDFESLQKELSSLKGRMTQRSDTDHRALIGAQAKYDSVYQAFGDAAPRFLDGEDLSSYRRRLASDLKKHSKLWKEVDVSALADSAFDVAEGQILADSVAVAQNPVDIPAGILREIKTRDKTGREISTFYGRSSDWMSSFSGPGRRAKIAPRPTNVTLQ